MGTGLPFQVADSVVLASPDEPRKVKPFFAASAVKVWVFAKPEKWGLGGVLSTENSWLAGADVVPPGAVAVADMMYLPSGNPLMSRPSMIHLPSPSAVTV